VPLFVMNMSAAIYYRGQGMKRGSVYTTDQMTEGGKATPTFVYSSVPPASMSERKLVRASAPPTQRDQLNFCYDFQNPVKCLRGKTVVFFGDSHMLNLAQMLCRMVLKHYPADQRGQFQGPCGNLDVRFTAPLHVVFFPAANITIALLRVRYNLEAQLALRFNKHHLAHFLTQTASFVLYNRAIWDLVYKDTDRKVVAAEMAESLKHLARKFPRARIIVKQLQYDQRFMKGCSDPERMRQIRDANLCATHLAMQDVAQVRRMQLRRAYRALFADPNVYGLEDGKPEPRFLSRDTDGAPGTPALPTEETLSGGENGNNKNKLIFPPTGVFDPHWKFSVLDSFGMTRELPYGWDGATDSLGHHYEGAALESMVQQMLSIMCPSQPQNHTLNYEALIRAAGEESCARVLYNTSTLRKPRCACNTRYSWLSTRESKEWCTMIARAGNWVAFIVAM
jgi:hypothetical protein